MVFLDADARLEPDALARIAALMERRGLDLASGFPRQVTRTLAEQLVIPQVHVLLLGYLPLPFAAAFRGRGFAAGCGQLMAVRRAAYGAVGGHGAIRASRHDGVTLPRAFRAAGFRTGLFDATPLARCRMYEDAAAVWRGFSKNATEGMARPVTLPVWTVLLGGGHVLPFVLVPVAEIAGNPGALRLAAIAVALVAGARGRWWRRAWGSRRSACCCTRSAWRSCWRFSGPRSGPRGGASRRAGAGGPTTPE